MKIQHGENLNIKTGVVQGDLNMGLDILSRKVVPQALANCQVHFISALASTHHQPATCLLSLVFSFGVTSRNECLFIYFDLMKHNTIIPRSVANMRTMRTSYVFPTSTVHVLRTCIKINRSLYMCSIPFNHGAPVIVEE